MPSLQQFRYLVALSETLHFRRAAERCHVSQPTLSGQIRELEDRLGAQLVERGRRAKVVLTPTGKEIAARARQVLRDVGDIVELAKFGREWLNGTIRLGVLPTLGPYLLPHVLPELHQSYPQLRLYVREGMPGALINALEDGDLDLLLFPLPVREADLTFARLFREPLWIVAPADHPLAAKPFAEPADLKGATVLALEPGHRLHDQVRALCQDYGAVLSLDYEGTSLDALRLMVGMGMGLSFLPALYVRSETPKDHEVVARPLRQRPPSRLIAMVWRRHSARGEEFQTLAGLIRGMLRSRVPEISFVD
jgi:LysR family hydrogen peroxide-inducible transcriptional activator